MRIRGILLLFAPFFTKRWARTISSLVLVTYSSFGRFLTQSLSFHLDDVLCDFVMLCVTLFLAL